MTDSQLKYQTLMEEQRHNLVMEEYSRREQESKRVQAEASAIQARVAEYNSASNRIQALASQRQSEASHLSAQANLINAEAARSQASTREKELEVKWNQRGWDIGFGIASFLIPDANTALRAGAQVVSSLFG